MPLGSASELEIIVQQVLAAEFGRDALHCDLNGSDCERVFDGGEKVPLDGHASPHTSGRSMRAVDHYVPASIRDRRQQDRLAESVAWNVAEVWFVHVAMGLQPHTDPLADSVKRLAAGPRRASARAHRISQVQLWPPVAVNV